MKKKIFFSFLAIAFFVFVFLVMRSKNNETNSIVPEEAEQGYVFSIDGKSHSLVNGCDAYEAEADKWNLIDQICYDPDYKERYVLNDNQWMVRADDGRMAPLPTKLATGFEAAATLKDLFAIDGTENVWDTFTLQSPKSSTVEEYVALRNCILASSCDFLDSRIDLSGERIHAGRQALRFFSVAPSNDMITAKASLETHLLRFAKGDDVWYSAWYYLEQGVPTAIMDLESAWLKEYPGPRLWVNEDRSLEIELKALDKPRYRQQQEKTVLPMKQWTHIVLHYVLSNDESGRIQLWQDEKKIIDARGKNIPFPDTILNSLEIGITTSSYQQDVVLFVDDVLLSKNPLPGYQ